MFAQTRRDGRLLVTVADETGAVIPGASVTVAGQETATRTATPPQVRTSDQGIAAIAGLAPGRYMIQAEFPGFAPQAIRDVRVRTGDNKQSITLSIGKLQTEVTVGRDVQESKVDSRGLTFGSALTREQIDALSDDPNEMRRQLADMAGPGSVIRVDSFEGGDLPPKSQIKSIHVTRDALPEQEHRQQSRDRRLRPAGARLQQEDASHTFRIQEAGPIGRRFFINTRLNLNWQHNAALGD